MKTKICTILIFLAALSCLTTLSAQTSSDTQCIGFIPNTSKISTVINFIPDIGNLHGSKDYPANKPDDWPDGWEWPPTTPAHIAYYYFWYVWLPVELSSFTATSLSNQQVFIQWTTQSETEVSGFYLLRGTSQSINSAVTICDLIQSTNTSNETSYSFVDDELEPGIWYYWLENLDMDGTTEFHGPISVTLSNDNDPDNLIIPNFPSLNNPFPNPFSFSTTISFELNKAGKAQLEVFNLKGEKVRTLVSGEKAGGIYLIPWDGKDLRNKNCPPGVYFIIMKYGEYVASRKIVHI